MTSATQAAPWLKVFELIERYEDALAIMMLFEYRPDELAANGVPIVAALDVALASERPVSERLARAANEKLGSNFQYDDFYMPLRGGDASAKEIKSFVDRCAAQGIAFSYVKSRSLQEIFKAEDESI